MDRLVGFWCLSVISLCFNSLCLHSQNNSDRYSSNSVLSSGNWKKIKVEKDGIYKIPYSELKKMGFDDPLKVSVHGYGGNALSEDFTHPYIDDLPAVNVYRANDCLFFYAKGKTEWKYNSYTRGFEHINNPYSDYGCYFISDLGLSKDMGVEPTLEGTALQITTFDDYVLHEKDLVSINKSGRDLFGEKLSSGSTKISINSNFSGITNEEGRIEYRVVSRISKQNTVTLLVNDMPISRNVPGLETSSERNFQQYVKAKPLIASAKWTGDKNSKPNVQISCSENESTNSYLDWIRFQFKRELKMYSDSCMLIRSISSLNNKSEFIIGGGADKILVFDVTDPLVAKVMETRQKDNGTSFIIPASNILREFAVVKADKGISVISSKDAFSIENQNLHGLPFVDMVIISPRSFVSEAKRLLNAHLEHNDIENGVVVTPEEIYNEFSSGTPDATAYRRFLKMFYDRGVAPKYLLLFGDGTYDNRFVTSAWKQLKPNKDNFLLTYQTEESLNMYSYIADDYFGMLDDNEDIFHYDTIRTSNNRISDVRPISKAIIDVGVGRFPIRNLSQARQTVDKVIAYMENSVIGNWKNSLCFIADDGSNADKFSLQHQATARMITDTIESRFPEYTVNKVFFDSYKKEAGNSTYPAVNTEIRKRLNEGCLILNYTGHGNSEALSDEHVITHNDILRYKYSCLPVWITATCEFCRYDDVSTSSGEDVFLNAKSGGIGLFTTTRVAFTDINELINYHLAINLLDKKNRFGLGDVIRKTKNDIINLDRNGNGRRLGFSLVGDPALRLNYPKHRINLTAINGKELDGDVVRFNAMDKVTLEGELVDIDDNLVSDFEGVISTKAFDAKSTVTTLGNNYMGNKMSYKQYSNIIYLGDNKVSGGKFQFSFVVPKDISYSTKDLGKMSFYAYNMEGEEASGSYSNYIVSGTSDNTQNDNESPDIIELYLNDSTFVDGGVVNSSPMLFVRLWDKSGVNITGSSIGHDITITIDGNPYLSYILNSYYENVFEKEGEGTIKFSIPELEPGIHEAEFKAWDVLNNSTTYTFQFEVEKGLRPSLINLYASQSPDRSQVTFHLTHNRPGSNMRVGIMVYDLTGRLQWRHEESGSSDMFKDYTITWDLTNNMGSKIRTGIYIYRAAISTDNSKEATDAKKIILLY